MFHKVVAKRSIVLASLPPSLFSGTVITHADSENEENKELIRPRDLPIYKKHTENGKQVENTEEPKPETSLTLAVRKMRETVLAVNDQVTDRVNQVIETGKAHTSRAMETFHEDDNYLIRFGAITIGGLLGYLIALQRGRLRRVIHTTAGAAIIASVCYPDEASELTSKSYQQVKRVIVFFYHIVNDAKKQQSTSSKKSLDKSPKQDEDSESSNPQPETTSSDIQEPDPTVKSASSSDQSLQSTRN